MDACFWLTFGDNHDPSTKGELQAESTSSTNNSATAAEDEEPLVLSRLDVLPGDSSIGYRLVISCVKIIIVVSQCSIFPLSLCDTKTPVQNQIPSTQSAIKEIPALQIIKPLKKNELS